MRCKFEYKVTIYYCLGQTLSDESGYAADESELPI